MCRLFGWGRRTEDKANAFSLLRAEAEKGDAIAEDLVGYCYPHQEALRWHLSAANHGNVLGQCNVAIAYGTAGCGVSKDETQAVTWVQIAADQGYAHGFYLLARYYQHE